MTRKERSTCIAVLILLATFAGPVLAQDSLLPEDVREAADSAVNQALTFIDSAASYLGQGVLYLLNLITGDRVSSNLEKPIGYLAFITLILLLFGVLDFARKAIWVGIIVGWVLLIVRIILDALNL